jgi:hypothetical protein
MGKKRGGVDGFLTRRHVAPARPQPFFDGWGRACGRWIFQEEEMGKIAIKDLSENVDLDRKAMQAISGGARLRSQGGAGAVQPVRGQKIVDLRSGAVRRAGKAAK